MITDTTTVRRPTPEDYGIDLTDFSSPERRLVRDLARYVDPKTYRGSSHSDCLIGQLGWVKFGPTWTFEALALAYNIATFPLLNIYSAAMLDSYNDDVGAALRMAAHLLYNQSVKRAAPTTRPSRQAAE